MALVPTFNNIQIRKHLRDSLIKIRLAAVRRLQRVGETFINNARTIKTYKDRTSNLKNSKGYIILEDGKEVADGGFPAGGTGEAVGRSVLAGIADNYKTGLVLICVAGMDYAAAVEAKGYDVITGSSQIAIGDLKRSMAELRNKVNSM